MKWYVIQKSCQQTWIISKPDVSKAYLYDFRFPSAVVDDKEVVGVYLKRRQNRLMKQPWKGRLVRLQQQLAPNKRKGRNGKRGRENEEEGEKEELKE